MNRRTEIPLRLLAILLGIGRRHPALLAAMKKEFGVADLAENTERRVSTALANTLFAWLHRQTQDRALFLELGLQGPISAGGPLGVYLVACPSLFSALGEFQNLYPLLAWDGSQCRVQPHARGLLVEISGLETRSIADLLRVDLLLGRLLKLARRLAGDAARPLLLVYPETGFGLPEGLAEHTAQLAQAPGRLALLFAEADAQRPADYPNPWLLEVLRPELDRELEQLQRTDTLAAQIRAWLASMPSLGEASQAAAALRFHLSESSLKRRLAEEHTSFTDLLQGLRRDRALELLTTTDDKLESIALALGFSERASFERAFRSWFDSTPSSYRESIRRLTGGAVSVESLDIDRLPASPRVCTQILELLNREDYHLDELVHLVGLDPALTAKIMGIARSAFYGGRAVRGLDDAIGTVLGVDQVRYLALISAANAEFSRNLPPSFDLARYWLEALLRAGLATALAPAGGADPAAARYTVSLAALLLDIGSYLLAHMHPARMEEFLAGSRALDTGAARLALERASFGSTLRAAGALLMAHWNLPREAIRIVRELDSADATAETSPEALLVGAIANFVHERAAAPDPQAARADFVAAAARIAGLPPETAERAVRRQEEQLAELEALVAQLVR